MSNKTISRIDQQISVTLRGLIQKIFTFYQLNAPRFRRKWSHPLTRDLLHQKISPLATFSPWLNDEDFQECYARIRHNTLVDIYRCYELWCIAKQLTHVEGCFLEVGVWRGGTGALIASAAKSTNQSR